MSDLEKTVTKLADNEGAIVDTIGDIIAYLETMEKRFAHLSGHVGELSKRPSVIVRPNSKVFLLTAVVASGYFGYKLADRKFRDKLQEMAKQAKDAVEQAAQEARERYEQSAQDAKTQAKPGPYDTYPTTRSVDSTDNDI